MSADEIAPCQLPPLRNQAAPMPLPELPDDSPLAVGLRDEKIIAEIQRLCAAFPKNGTSIVEKERARGSIAVRLAELSNHRRQDLIRDVAQVCGGTAREWGGRVGDLRATPDTGQSRPDDGQATRLVALAKDAEFFHDGDVCFAAVPAEAHRENLRLRSPAFLRWLGRRYFDAERRAPNANALRDAITVLEGRAQFEGPAHSTHVRVAEHDGAIYLDLGGDAWDAVRITPDGWGIVRTPPVKFVRPRGMLPLPFPTTGGKLADLRPFVNATDEDWPLFAGSLVAALRPRGPFPILVLHGEQGSAKSTTARVFRALVDPATAPLRAEPRDARDAMIAARNGWVLAFDNLSNLRPWLSDVLCRLSTGGGFATRQLYEDAEEVIFDAQRPIILNGIEEVATRGDLLDRTLLLYLPTIAEERRQTETEFWREFEEARPHILGALLNGVSVALRRLPEVKLERLPRMADLTAWVTAAEPGLGLEPGEFLRAYSSNRKDANALTLEAASISKPLLALLEQQPNWVGTASELLRAIADRMSPPLPMGWPSNGHSLAGKLRRLAPALRAAGVGVDLGRKSGSRRLVKLCKSASHASLPSQAQENPANSTDEDPDLWDARDGRDGDSQ